MIIWRSTLCTFHLFLEKDNHARLIWSMHLGARRNGSVPEALFISVLKKDGDSLLLEGASESSRNRIHLATNVRRSDRVGVCTSSSIDSRNEKLWRNDIHGRSQLASGKEKSKDELWRCHLHSSFWCERGVRITDVEGDVVASSLNSYGWRESSDRHVGVKTDILLAVPLATSWKPNRWFQWTTNWTTRWAPLESVRRKRVRRDYQLLEICLEKILRESCQTMTIGMIAARLRTRPRKIPKSVKWNLLDLDGAKKDSHGLFRVTHFRQAPSLLVDDVGGLFDVVAFVVEGVVHSVDCIVWLASHGWALLLLIKPSLE